MTRLLLIPLLALAFIGPSHAALQNSLANNASPYLKMHGHDPVAWQIWDEQAVKMASQQKKLLFVSIGYFACHWCHVMQRESYQNAAIAEVLNKHFIPVKVDRELNPALDARMIEFVQATRGYSGWPLNVFITPQGHPLVGFVYLPPEDFKKLLTNLVSAWQEDPQGLARDAAAAANDFTQPVMNTSPAIPKDLPGQALTSYVQAIWKTADEFGGGFGTGAKFPSSPQLLALLKSYQQSPDERVARFLKLTLDKMASLGLHDLIGGGFFRYTTDPEWQVPHFEKMLYDNAQLARVYLLAAKMLNTPRYQEVAFETLDFMLRELRLPSGAFAASLSAIDNKNVEGGYYLFSNDTLKNTLSKQEFDAVRLCWIQETSPTTDDGHLPFLHDDISKLAARSGQSVKQLEDLLTAAKRKLADLRKARSLPIDNKQLAAWNGLALLAFAEAVRQTDNPRYREAGERLQHFINTTFIQGDQLRRSTDKQGNTIGKATLEDYAFVAAGLFAWSEATGITHDLDRVGKIIQQAWDRFYTPNGWKMSEQLLVQYGSTEVVMADTALPSPSAVLIHTSIQYARKAKDDALLKRSLAALNNGQDLIIDDAYWFATHIAALYDSQ